MDVDAMFAMGPHGGVGGAPDLMSFPDDMMDEQWINLIRDTGVFDFSAGSPNGGVTSGMNGSVDGVTNGGMNFASPTDSRMNGQPFQSR